MYLQCFGRKCTVTFPWPGSAVAESRSVESSREREGKHSLCPAAFFMVLNVSFESFFLSRCYSSPYISVHSAAFYTSESIFRHTGVFFRHNVYLFADAALTFRNGVRAAFFPPRQQLLSNP